MKKNFNFPIGYHKYLDDTHLNFFTTSMRISYLLSVYYEITVKLLFGLNGYKKELLVNKEIFSIINIE